MSLTEAIKFRFLSAQLTTDETFQFAKTLINNEINIINSALFHYIKNIQASHINDTVSNIILSRKKKLKPIPARNIKLDRLPKRLIGVIASFLQQNDHFNDYTDFSQTNRWIYLGCNSPNLMQQLSLTNVKDYSLVNLALYPSVKHLRINLPPHQKLFPVKPEPSVMNQLKSLLLNARAKDDIDIDQFLESNYINTNNVTHLSCAFFGKQIADEYIYEPFPGNKFLKLLKKFNNLQYLHFYSVISDIDVEQMRDLNLKGLALVDVNEPRNKALIHMFGNDLDFLQLEILVQSSFDYELHKINFQNLTELILDIASMEALNGILKTAKKLQKIGISSDFMTNDQLKSTITSVITLCPSLKYIQYLAGEEDEKCIDCLLDGFVEGLNQTKTYNRKEFMVRIIMGNDNISKEFTVKLGKVIECLVNSLIDDFMFIFCLEKLGDINVNGMLEAFKKLSKDIDVMHNILETDECEFVLQNKECKINGTLQIWKIDVDDEFCALCDYR